LLDHIKFDGNSPMSWYADTGAIKL
jgi:hypothetical protein